MNKIIMLIGAAASGKTTAAPKIAANNNAVIISTDRIRAALIAAIYKRKRIIKIISAKF